MQRCPTAILPMDHTSKKISLNPLTPTLTAIKARLERQGVGFRWLSGVEAKGTPAVGQFASTPLSERLTQWQ